MLLIFPAERKLNWNTPPVATLFLIILNILIYFSFQTSEQEQLKDVIDYYRTSPLLEIEYPKYAELKKEDYLKIDDNAQQPSDQIIFEMLFDSQWNKLLEKGLIPETSENYQEWASSRQIFNDKLKLIPFYTLGYKPGKSTINNSITYMFLHGGFGHLLGNMVFLLIFGFSLEIIFGKLKYLGIYLSSGIFSALFFGLFNSESYLPLVGASGAIAGLMGSYATVYGLKKIKFFYWILGYFNYIRLPALIVLPVWIAKEVWEYSTQEGSNVAYLAHVGGLLGGAVVTFLVIKYLKISNTEYVESNDEKDGTDPFTIELEYAITQMRKLNFPRARTTLVDLLKQQPDNLRVLELLYNIDKIKPETANFKKLVNHIFEITRKHRDLDDWTHEKYLEFRQLSPRGGLSLQRLLDLCHRFIRSNFLADAEKIITLVEGARPDTEILPELMMQVANAYIKNDQRIKARRWLVKLEKEYKHSNWSQHASRVLDRIDKNQEI